MASWTLSSTVTDTQTTAINNILWKVFDGWISFLYTIVDIFVTFFTQPAVLWGLAWILVISVVYRKFKARVWG